MKTFTYSDIDLNFLPTISSQDRYNGVGAILCWKNSNIVTGLNTLFTQNLIVNDNIYINSVLVGKIASIESDTSMTMTTNCYISADPTNILIEETSEETAKILLAWGDDMSWSITNWNIETKTIHYKAMPDDCIYGTIDTQEYPILDTYVYLPWNSENWNNKTWSFESIVYTFNFTSKDIPDGTQIPYTATGIIPSDFYFPSLSNLSYGGVEGHTVIENNKAVLNFIYSPEIPLPKILKFPDVKIYLHSKIIYVPFTHSSPSDISLLYDNNSIKASIRNLIQTMNYERKFNSAVGSQVNAIMFELVSPNIQNILTRSITDIISSYEPRAKILDVAVSVMNEYVNITIIFAVVNTTSPITINMVLERTR